MQLGHPSPSGISLPATKLGKLFFCFQRRRQSRRDGQQEEVLAAKSDDPSSIPETRMVEGEDRQKADLLSPHMLFGV